MSYLFIGLLWMLWCMYWGLVNIDVLGLCFAC